MMKKLMGQKSDECSKVVVLRKIKRIQEQAIGINGKFIFLIKLPPERPLEYPEYHEISRKREKAYKNKAIILSLEFY